MYSGYGYEPQYYKKQCVIARTPEVAKALFERRKESLFRFMEYRNTLYYDHYDSVLFRKNLTLEEFINEKIRAFSILDSNTPMEEWVPEYRQIMCSFILGGGPALAIATRIGLRQIVDDLIDIGIHPDALDSQGKTPLMWTAIEAKIEMMQYLIDKKANVNAVVMYPAPFGPMNALTFAVRNGDLPTVQLLVKNGAKIERTSHMGIVVEGFLIRNNLQLEEVENDAMDIEMQIKEQTEEQLLRYQKYKRAYSMMG